MLKKIIIPRKHFAFFLANFDIRSMGHSKNTHSNFTVKALQNTLIQDDFGREHFIHIMGRIQKLRISLEIITETVVV